MFVALMSFFWSECVIFFSEVGKDNRWNVSEICLLTVGLAMTGLTTTLIANDLHYSQSRSTALVLIVLVIGLVSTICGAMIALATWLNLFLLVPCIYIYTYLDKDII